MEGMQMVAHEKSGTLTRGVVDLGDGPRTVTVYLPPDWLRVRPQAAVYYLHGAGYDGTTLLGGGVLPETRLKRRVDALIANNEAPSVMIVLPHYSDATDPQAAMQSVAATPEMLRRLTSWAEPTFLCRAGRPHRAVIGFSMGGACVWEALLRANDLFSRYAPVGSDCWELGYEGGRHNPTGTARAIVEAVGKSHAHADVHAWCGRDDPSAPWVARQVDEMRRLSYGPGALDFTLESRFGHEEPSVNDALIDCLRSFAEGHTSSAKA